MNLQHQLPAQIFLLNPRCLFIAASSSPALGMRSLREVGDICSSVIHHHPGNLNLLQSPSHPVSPTGDQGRPMTVIPDTTHHHKTLSSFICYLVLKSPTISVSTTLTMDRLQFLSSQIASKVSYWVLLSFIIIGSKCNHVMFTTFQAFPKVFTIIHKNQNIPHSPCHLLCRICPPSC